MTKQANRADFRAVLITEGKTATGIVVPDEVVAHLDQGKRPPVRVTIGAHTYRSTIAVMGGRFMLPVSAENRTAAGVRAGDELDVSLELDNEPREVELPADFVAALDAQPAARAFFDGLSFSAKRGIVGPIDQAKAAETRARRIEKSVANLAAGIAR